jgi:hypothetical protein
MAAQRQFRDAGGIKTVLGILEDFKNQPDVVKSVIGAIVALARDETTRDILIDEGLCEKMVDVVRQYLLNPNILRNFVLAYVTLSESEYGKIRISEKMRSTFNSIEIDIVVDELMIIADDNCLLQEYDTR